MCGSGAAFRFTNIEKSSGRAAPCSPSLTPCPRALSLLPLSPQVVDALEDQLAVGGVILDYHSCDFFPERWFDLVLVLTTDNAALYQRLASRGYTPAKITANVECEIMRVCADEAGEAYDEAIVKVLPSNSVEEMEENVAWVAAWVDKVSGSGGGGGGGGKAGPPPA